MTKETEALKSSSEVLVTEILSQPLSLTPVVLIRNKDIPRGHPEDNTQPTYDITEALRAQRVNESSPY